MKKIILIIISFALLLFSGCTKSGNNSDPTTDPTTKQPEDPKVSDYFPLKADVHMKYFGEGNEFAEYETFVDFINGNKIQLRVVNPGTISAEVYTVDDDALTLVYAEGEVYYRHDFTSMATNDEILIKAPITVGTSWNIKNSATRTITAIDKKVTVKAGEFDTLEVTTEAEDYTTTQYYARDIGLIKEVYSTREVIGTDSFSVTSELEKMETDAEQTQSVNIYYPQYDNDMRLVYVSHEIALKTGDNANDKLVELLKTVPEGIGLTPGLSKNAKLQSVVIDNENGILTLDFSEELISEMTGGAAMESLLVQSITNTFGVYYQKDKVVIKAGGKLYEGGHIALNEGEFFMVTKDVPEFKLD